MNEVRLMNIDVLSEEEKRDVLRCMRVILESNLIYDEEFETRVGLYREELREIIDAWPPVGVIEENSVTYDGINGSLCEICYGVAISELKPFGISRPEMTLIFRKMKYTVDQDSGTSHNA